jgi:hypothetical protein
LFPLLVVTFTAGAACPLDPGGRDAGALVCEVTAPTECTRPELRFADVQPIINRACVPCHDAEFGGPWPLVSHMDVADWADTVRDDIANCFMPPPEDAGGLMTDAEKLLVLEWLRCGFPQ